MDDVTRAMSKGGGGGACGYLCKISGKSTPLPPLTKAFPYAYVAKPWVAPLVVPWHSQELPTMGPSGDVGSN